MWACNAKQRALGMLGRDLRTSCVRAFDWAEHKPLHRRQSWERGEGCMRATALHGL